jgi:prepilin-type N-terminal cleavage/methylation domain-containing protein
MKNRAGRQGFTLVELLVVIGIIAILAALVTPAVFRARAAARAAAVKAEIDMLHMAIMKYKTEYGSFPPANMAGLWNGGSVNTTHPVYVHLRKIFPRINEPTSGAGSPYLYIAQMSPAQALVFWLQGFFENPEFPLTNGVPLNATLTRAGTNAGERKKLYDFEESRLRAASAYFSPASSPTVTPQTFSALNAHAGGSFQREYPVYFPNSPNAGLPYVYFSASSYRVPPTAGPTFNDLEYRATSASGASTTAYPYLLSTASTTDSWVECHQNATSFQLIAAGEDGTYGVARASFPGDFPLLFGVPSGTVLSAAFVPGHEDNITNFADGRLQAAAEKLLN